MLDVRDKFIVLLVWLLVQNLLLFVGSFYIATGHELNPIVDISFVLIALMHGLDRVKVLFGISKLQRWVKVDSFSWFSPTSEVLVVIRFIQFRIILVPGIVDGTWAHAPAGAHLQVDCFLKHVVVLSQLLVVRSQHLVVVPMKASHGIVAALLDVSSSSRCWNKEDGTEHNKNDREDEKDDGGNPRAETTHRPPIQKGSDHAESRDQNHETSDDLCRIEGNLMNIIKFFASCAFSSVLSNFQNNAEGLILGNLHREDDQEED